MLKLTSIPSMNLIGLLVSTFLLAASIYFQVFDGFIPCPLCMLQRTAFGMLSLLFLLGLISAHRIMRLLTSIFASLFSLLGIFLAGRQIWLQHFPPTDGTECSVSIQYMMQVLPWHEVLQHVIKGGAECSQRGFELLMLNMAEWSFISFIAIFVLTLFLLRKCINARKTI